MILAIVLVGAGYFFLPRFEWNKPQIKLTPDIDTIGLGPIEIEVTDQGTGLKSLNATLSPGGTEHTCSRNITTSRSCRRK